MSDGIRVPAMVCGVIFIVFGLVSIFVFGRLDEQKIKRCSKETKAVVVRIKEKGKAEDKSLEYVTDLVYTVDEQEYKVRYTLDKDLKMDTKIKLKYNPDDPSEHYIEGIDKTGGSSRVIGAVAIGAGLIVMAISGGVITTRTFGE